MEKTRITPKLPSEVKSYLARLQRYATGMGSKRNKCKSQSEVTVCLMSISEDLQQILTDEGLHINVIK